jgi:outer membrane protein OmpA-like peptidoglycan-associated protein
MRPLPLLSAVFVTAAAPVFAQVTVDLHALQALPERPAASRPARPPSQPTYAPAPFTAREAPRATQPASPPNQSAPAEPARSQTAPTAPTQAPAAQPAVPETVPDVASITPIAPPPPAVGSPPPAPPVSDKATTAATPTSAGLRLTFAPGQSDLSPESAASIKQLAAATTQGDATTFNVSAYAPGKPDDPSTARRMSLSRAMAVRSALVADGVASARIFVRALGEQHGEGPPDRVDVNVMGAGPPETATVK